MTKGKPPKWVIQVYMLPNFEPSSPLPQSTCQRLLRCTDINDLETRTRQKARFGELFLVQIPESKNAGSRSNQICKQSESEPKPPNKDSQIERQDLQLKTLSACSLNNCNRLQKKKIL